MMDVNDLISAAVQLFNEKKYAEAIEILHQAWDGITDKNTQILLKAQELRDELTSVLLPAFKKLE